MKLRSWDIFNFGVHISGTEREPHPLTVTVHPSFVGDKNCRLTTLSTLSLTKRESETLEWKASSTSDIKCSSKSCEKTKVKETQNIKKHNHHMLDGGSGKKYIVSLKIKYYLLYFRPQKAPSVLIS